ncbi:MAG: cupin domain-containing protein [Bacteroidales bacterium]|jgi:mannose-6-phosphate isomerase-like protein (cupin superfamily)|nr:cupin domain-containing protein [Bacteroidales bacterium]MDD2263556.1 cupin domain-containing protein [Bacteroidales bacterium]MDD2830653.1 cupin domain-containing protein [Bacteroidales bacterium]MDD3207852.1 cupin domain-containing protein [Bacteroidales bacterium]MDD3696640.1 cupin domain-containing protein [Bacteroidales bacterium]
MKIISYTDIETSNNPHGVDARVIFNTDMVQVVHISLRKGEGLKLHTTPIDVFFYILEGEGYIEIGDETRKVMKDMLIDSPKDIPHRPYNQDSDVFRLLVIKLKKTA